MKGWRVVRDRLRGLFRRDAVIGDIDDEMRAHIDLAAEENQRRGMPPDEARRAARKSFGNVGVMRDVAYDVRGGGRLESWWQDFRFAFRMLRRKPSLTVSALFTWALGIGATVAVFSVVHPLLLQGLPYREPDRLVRVMETNPPQFPRFSASPPHFIAWRDQHEVFEGLAAFVRETFSLTGVGEPMRVKALHVSPGFFEVFGVTPRLGRSFAADEEDPDRGTVAILEDGFWQRRFGGDPGILGRTITLNDKPFTVVGVMPPGIHRTMGEVDLWVPQTFTAKDRQQQGAHYLRVVGRLKPGVSLAAARDALNQVAVRLEKEFPADNTGWRVKADTLHESLVEDVRPTLIVLAAAVAFVLLIAAANVASLLLGRASSREREIAVRVALGAGRWRILRQLAVESVVLAVLGGALALVLAVVGVDLLLALAPEGLAGLKSIHVDVPLLIFTFVASVLTGIIVAFAPARQAARADLNSTLREGHGNPMSKGRAGVRRVLVTLEVAACLLLLVGTGLLVRSLVLLLSVDPGFVAENVVTMRLDLSKEKYKDDASQIAFIQRTVDEIRNLPGVRAAALAQAVPFQGDWWFSFTVDGRPPPPPNQEPSANFYAVTPEYFQAMGIRLLRGRTFTDADTATSRRVVVVNEKLAREIFPDGNAIGQHIQWNKDESEEIIGVVADVKEQNLSSPTDMQMYDVLQQRPFVGLQIVIRATGDPASLGNSVRARIAGIDAALPVAEVKLMKNIVSDSESRRRFSVVLLSIFAGVALLLAIVGIYGVISDSVTQRTHEIGIRMALGARAPHVLRLMMGQGMVPALIGIAVGLVACLGATRLLASMLFGVDATDVPTLLLSSGLIALVALVASYLPARRATRVDPMVALRID